MKRTALLLAATLCSAAAMASLFDMATRGIDLNKLPSGPAIQTASLASAGEDLVLTYSYRQDTSGRVTADKITAVSNISELVSDCKQHYMEGRLDEVSYANGRFPSVIVVANGKASEVFELPNLQQRTPAADHGHLRNFFRRNAKVFLVYQVCGASGRVVELRDVFAR